MKIKTTFFAAVIAGALAPVTPSYGQINAWGDGSAGALTIAADTDWGVSPPSMNMQFSSININAKLKIPSGFVLRAMGDIVIGPSGVIEVSHGPLGGIAYQGIATTPSTSRYPGHLGLSGPGSVYSILHAPVFGGASGAPQMWGANVVGAAGAGGGALTLRAGGMIWINGYINANAMAGAAGAGGGGGGVVILAAKGGLSVAARMPALGAHVKARGGAGSLGKFVTEGVWENARGCGGGGGLVVVLGPNADSMSTIADLAGGPDPGALDNVVRGATGGTSGGLGGWQGDCTGRDGKVITIQVNEPSYLFM